MGAGKNKVFLELSGKPVWLRTLQKFSRVDDVGAMILVVQESEVAQMRRMLAATAGLKPCQVVAGGAERQYSIANGLRALDERTQIVLVHDAARPLVSETTIRKVIAAACEHGAAIAAVREKNTVKSVDERLMVQGTLNRQCLWEVQTPQGFQKDILLKAYRKAGQDGFLGTDDASLVERLGLPVAVVESDYRNIKLTTPEDLLVAEAFLAAGENISCKAR